MSSTHPICATIADTDEAEDLFDGISYGKGSAFVKQLYKLLGHSTMSKGLHLYFEKHKWANTVLPDFVSAMDSAFKEKGEDLSIYGNDFSLQKWCSSWLNSSGINIIEPTDLVVEGYTLTMTLV